MSLADQWKYPRKKDSDWINEEIGQHLHYLERQQLTLPAIKDSSAKHCEVHSRLARLYFMKARLISVLGKNSRAMTVIMLEKVEQELETVLTLCGLSIPEITDLKADPTGRRWFDAMEDTQSKDLRLMALSYADCLAAIKYIKTSEAWRGQQCKEHAWTVFETCDRFPERAQKVLSLSTNGR